MFGTLLKRKSARGIIPSSSLRPAPLTDGHLILLSRAAARDDRRIIMSSEQDEVGMREALALLIERGLVDQNGEGEDAPFRISAAGLAHIGLSEEDVDPLSSPPHTASSGCAASEVSALNYSLEPAMSLSNPRSNPGPSRLRTAPHEQAGLWRASAKTSPSRRRNPALTSGRAKAGGSKTDEPGARRTPSASSPAPSRKTALITLLQRLEGATLQQICETFGWLPHSARAALSGLRKAGHGIERRARSEGEDAIYRIIPASPAEPVGEAVADRSGRP